MLGNWVRTTTTTTGTGNLTVSAVSGYPSFNDVFGTGRYFHYGVLDDSTGKPIECGIGHLSASTTLVRDKVLATFASSTYDDTAPAAISLAAGTYRVICANEAMAAQLGAMNINASASGRIMVPQTTPITVTASSFAVVADRCYYVPLLNFTPREVDAITCRVSTGSGSSTAKVALYSASTDGKPETKLYESGSFSTGTGAAGTAYANTFTQHRPQPGLCFLAFASSATPTMNSNTSTSLIPMSLLGSDATYVQGIVALYEALSGGWSALPATANTTLSVATQAPMMGLRVVT